MNPNGRSGFLRLVFHAARSDTSFARLSLRCHAGAVVPRSLAARRQDPLQHQDVHELSSSRATRVVSTTRTYAAVNTSPGSLLRPPDPAPSFACPEHDHLSGKLPAIWISVPAPRNRCSEDFRQSGRPDRTIGYSTVSGNGRLGSEQAVPVLQQAIHAGSRFSGSLHAPDFILRSCTDHCRIVPVPVRHEATRPPRRGRGMQSFRRLGVPMLLTAAVALVHREN